MATAPSAAPATAATRGPPSAFPTLGVTTVLLVVEVAALAPVPVGGCVVGGVTVADPDPDPDFVAETPLVVVERVWTPVEREPEGVQHERYEADVARVAVPL